MTPEQAHEILSEATQPQIMGRITREGYVQIDQALRVIGEAIVKPDMVRDGAMECAKKMER